MKIFLRYIFPVLIFLVTTGTAGYAAPVSGTVKDRAGDPVGYVTVILQHLDSVFVAAVVTPDDGSFSFDPAPGAGRLIFQHLSYETLVREYGPADTGSPLEIVLEETGTAIEAVVVRGRAPAVIVEGSALVYNGENLRRGRVVSSAYDMLTEVAGVYEQEGEIQLAGMGAVPVLLNGEVSSMPRETLYTILKTIPADRVTSIEVMYNAPAKYNTRGAVINVVTTRSGEEKSLVGELSSSYIQSHNATGAGSGALFYKNKGLNVDVTANYEKGKRYNRLEDYARHTLADGSLHEIDQYSVSRGRGDKLNARAGLDYSFAGEDKVSLSYLLERNTGKGHTTGGTDFGVPAFRTVESMLESESRNHLHNGHLEYKGHAGYTVGADFIYYDDRGDRRYAERENGTLLANYSYGARQSIRHWKVFANHELALGERSSLQFGFNGGYYNTSSHSIYDFTTGQSSMSDSRVKQNERTANLFGEYNVANDKGLSLSLGLQGEFFNSRYNDRGTGRTLWSEWAFYPTATVTHAAESGNVFQFSLSSDRQYPTYWSVNPETTQTYPYMFYRGNPELKPATQYKAQFVYVIRNKYTLVAYTQYRHNFFAQMPYQDKDELRLIQQFVNLKYSFIQGVTASMAVRAGSVYALDLTVNPYFQKQRSDDFYGMRLDRSRFSGLVYAKNNVRLRSEYPQISLSVDMMATLRSLQGALYVNPMYSLNSGLKVTLKNGSCMQVDYKNILRRAFPNPLLLDWNGQYNEMRLSDFATVTVKFAWRFGQYSEKRFRGVDTSRFGRN